MGFRPTLLSRLHNTGLFLSTQTVALLFPKISLASEPLSGSQKAERYSCSLYICPTNVHAGPVGEKPYKMHVWPLCKTLICVNTQWRHSPLGLWAHRASPSSSLLTLSDPSGIPGTVRNFLNEQARAGRAGGMKETVSTEPHGNGNLFHHKQCPAPKFCFLSWVPQGVTMWWVQLPTTQNCILAILAFVTSYIIFPCLADLHLKFKWYLSSINGQMLKCSAEDQRDL